MKMLKPRYSKKSNILAFLIFSIIFLLGIFDFYQGFILLGNRPSLESKRQIGFYLALILPMAVWIQGAILAGRGFLLDRLASFQSNFQNRFPHPLRVVISIFVIFCPAIVFLFSSIGNYVFIYWLRLFIITLSGLLSAFLLFKEGSGLPWLLKAAGMVMVASAIFAICDRLTGVTDFPFTLYWSEGNRFWDYSIMFGVDRYINLSGERVIPFLESGRQFLWALPFLIPSIGIWGMRLWNVILWVLPPMALGWAAVFQKNSFGKNWFWQIGFGIWTFVFLNQGPIYPPLVVCALIVVIALRQRSLIAAVFLIAIATYYARISRWTWMYAPGLWAGLYSLCQIDHPSFWKNRWKQLLVPAILGISGLVGSEIIQWIILSTAKGSEAVPGAVQVVLSSVFDFKQPMLWERLFPNPTYPPGIILGYLWVGGPILIFLFLMAAKGIWQTNWIQRAAALVILIFFTIVGLIISIKIGGGSNLHNLDMLWVTIVILTGYVFKDWMDRGFPGLRDIRSIQFLLGLVVIFPATFLIQFGKPLIIPDGHFITTSLEKIETDIVEASQRGEVLFLDQRQLLTFGYVTNVPLVVEYEKKVLMDQALTGNPVYFADFYNDLENHRFSAIITEPLQRTIVFESERNFGEENNAWVHWVSRPLLKYYKPKVTHDEVGVQILIPRE